MSLGEFRLFYELDPNFGIDSSGYPALRDELFFYIDQIRAREKASEEGLLQDEIFRKAIKWEKRQAMLRQLFREVVLNEIEVSEEELRREYRAESIQVRVRHLFSTDKRRVVKWAARIRQGATFGELAGEAFSDSVLSRSGGDLGWVNLADLDAEFAEAVSGLKAGELSGIVKTQWGWHLIRLIDRKDEVILSEEEFKRRRPQLIKKVRNRKRDIQSAEYISDYLGKMNPQPVQHTFRMLWNSIRPAGIREETELPDKRVLSDFLVGRVRETLTGYLDEPLIIYRGGSVSLGSWLNAMTSVPAGHRPVFRTPRELSDQIGLWLRDDLLLQNAEDLDLERHERVRSEVERYTEEQSYYFYLNAILDTLQTPPAVQRYYSTVGHEKKSLSPELSRFHTLESWRWHRAGRILHKRLQSQPGRIEIVPEMLREEAGRIPWDRRVRMFRVRKPS